MTNDKVLEKINSIFKEELWGRIEPRDIGISKFKILDDLFNSAVSNGIMNELFELSKEHIKSHHESISASYLVGLIGYHAGSIENEGYLRKLIDVFTEYHKWSVVEILAEKILEYEESSTALRALAASLERLGRSREAIPFWESLLKIDRFDAEVAKKLAFAIIDDDQEKSIYYMKLSIEGFLKLRKFDEVSSLWNKLVSVSWEDTAFFNRIERMLVEAKQIELAAGLLKVLLNKYKEDENHIRSIEILKKILEYKPEDIHSRKEIIKLYGIIYAEHSQLKQFIEFSKLDNFKYPVKFAIPDFEKNIVFDIGNYAYHNSWGLGNIIEMDSESIKLNFLNKPDHKMSLQMALQSLKPVNKEHLYVKQFEDNESLKKQLKEKPGQFFELIIKSYGGTISVDDVKRELVPAYIDAKNWAKWWSKARTIIKQNPLFGISEKKKDLIFMRDKPVTFAEELLENFTKATSFSVKLAAAMEFSTNIEKQEAENFASYFIDYFSEEIKGDSITRLILSYFILKDFSKFTDKSKIKLDPIKAKVIDYVKNSSDLPLLSMKISSYDYKKEFINLIAESREDWPEIVSQILFEVPVRIHKYIISSLIRAHSYNIINEFIDRIIAGSRQTPEIFMWVSKNLLTNTWSYDWLDYSKENLAVTFFRMMNELKKIELEGNKLKNTAVEILYDNEMAVLKSIVSDIGLPFLNKLFELLKNVSYIDESQSGKFFELIKKKYPDFQSIAIDQADEAEFSYEKLIVTKEGYEKKKADLERMLNVEMINISKELAAVSEASADIRENIEYSSLIEKQSILKTSISKLDTEMKKADILDLEKISVDSVSIGTKVVFEDIEKSEKLDFTILGPWDADFESRILSYRSPIAIALMGHKPGEEVSVFIDNEERKFKIISIKKYNEA